MVDHKKVTLLLEELRSWPPGEQVATVKELSDRFGLPPLVIQRVARSEGMELQVGEVVSDDLVNDRAPTLPVGDSAWDAPDDDDLPDV